MKTNVAKIHSLGLAVLLQFSPLLKFLQSTPALANSPIANVLKWATAAAVMWGGFHAVSGASTAVLITSPTNSVGTNGTAYRYTITTSDTKTDAGHTFTATPRPPNLTLTVIQGGVPAIANITGTPTNFGVWLVRLTACHETICAVATNMLLTVYGKPIITNQPASVISSAGGNASFTVLAGALPLPTYRWRLGTTTLAGQTNATLNLTNISAGDAGNYTVVVSNFLGSITSAVATLTVASGAGPGILTQPHDATVLIGSSTNFSVIANGTPPLAYFWRKNGNPMGGVSGPTNNLTNVSATDAGGYSVIVSNSVNSITSSVANLYVARVPKITSLDRVGDQISIGFSRDAGAGYEILFATSVPTSNWQVLTNFPSQTQSTNTSVLDLVTNGAIRFYELRMTIP
jgi:hypothetical protein